MKYTVNSINELVNKGISIELSEKEYADNINRLTDRIFSEKDCRIVLLAGPSGSGKTTTSHILCDRIIARGRCCSVISLDHFYLDDADKPRLPDGSPDYESVYALDIDRFCQCYEQLIKTGKCNIPVYDFQKRKRAAREIPIDIGSDGIAVVEGLHALNPELTKNCGSDGALKVYISVLSQIVDESGKKLLSSRDLRLIRRLSRDSIYRNTSAENNLKLWKDVIAGEDKYLVPFKETAGFKFGTFHTFEPGLFSATIQKLFAGIGEDTPFKEKAEHISKVLSGFTAVPAALVPQESLIREFIDGGIYENKD